MEAKIQFKTERIVGRLKNDTLTFENTVKKLMLQLFANSRSITTQKLN